MFKSTPTLVPPARADVDALDNPTAARPQAQSLIEKFESLQAKHTKITDELKASNQEIKALMGAMLGEIDGKRATTTTSDPTRKALKKFGEVDALLKNKRLAEINLDFSKDELSETIDLLKASNTDNAIELDNLLSIARQKINAEVLSLARNELKSAQEILHSTQAVCDVSLKKLPNFFDNWQYHLSTLELVYDFFMKDNYPNEKIPFNFDKPFDEFLEWPEHLIVYIHARNSKNCYNNEKQFLAKTKLFLADVKNQLFHNQEDLQRLENILKEPNLALESNQTAFEQDAREFTALDDTALTSETRTHVPDDSDVAEGQLTLAGVNAPLEYL